MPRRTRAGFAAISLIFSGLATGEDLVQLAPLHVIPTENRSVKPIAADGPVRVRLSSPDLPALAAVLEVKLPANQASFEYVIGQYPQLRGAGTRTWLEPTFVIDFNEPEFEPLRQELAARATKTTRPQLVEYVADLIEASDERDWDLASVVARRRRGDCSEHAVLTTALARLQGIPARVVLGVALVSDEKGHGAFGHAWAETLEQGKWSVADAALFELDAAVRYVPIGLLEDEGMGYSMDLVRTMQMWIDRVIVLGP
jgi:hypothetical protein